MLAEHPNHDMLRYSLREGNMTTILKPSEYSKSVQEFLFTCAFWILAADEELTSVEQEWLISFFGADTNKRYLNKLLSLASGEFLPAFDRLVDTLTDDDKRNIYPVLSPWLCQCVTVDGKLRASENEVMQEIKQHVDLENELTRLTANPPPIPDTQPPTIPPLADIASPPENLYESSSKTEPEKTTTFVDTPPLERSEESAPTRNTPKMPPPSVDDSTAEALRPLHGHETEITAVCVHTNGHYALSGDKDGYLRLWDMDSHTCSHVWDQHKKEITGIAFHPQSHTAISADRTGTVIGWDFDSVTPRWQSNLQKLGGISDLAVSPDGKHAALCSPGCKIALIDWDTGEIIRTVRKKGWPAFRCITYHPNGRHLALGGDDKKLHLIDLATYETLQTFSGHQSALLSVASLLDGTRIATGSRDNNVCLWETATGSLLRTFEGHTFSVYGVAPNSDGTRLLSVSWDHTAKLWDTQTGALLLNVENPGGSFNAVVFLPESNRALIASSDDQLYILDTGA